MTDCFLKYVGLKSLCSDAPEPVSGLFLEGMIGMSDLKNAKIAGEKHISGKNLALDAGKEAAVKFMALLKLRLQADQYTIEEIKMTGEKGLATAKPKKYREIIFTVNFSQTILSNINAFLVLDGVNASSVIITPGPAGVRTIRFVTPVNAKTVEFWATSGPYQVKSVCALMSCDLCTFLGSGFFYTAFRSLWASQIELEAIAGSSLKKGDPDLLAYYQKDYEDNFDSEYIEFRNRFKDCFTCTSTSQVAFFSS